MRDLMMKQEALKAAFPYTLPVLTGYLFLGFSFGILLNGIGYHFLWALLMSTVIYAGAMQFVAIAILAGPFNLPGVIFLTLSVNARHLFYGLSVLDKYKDMGKKKLYMIFSLTDETYSLVCGITPPEGIEKNWFYFFISLLNQSYWITGSLLGSVIGSLLTFNTKGIDFVLTALFVVIFVEQWEKSGKNHLPALAGIAFTLLALLLFGQKSFIIISMVLQLIFLSLLAPWLGGQSDDSDSGHH